MKNENGITLVALVVTIIVMLILASVTTYSGIESYKEVKKDAFISQMKVIQEKVDLIKTEYKNWSGYKYYDTTTEDGANAYKENLEKYLKDVYEIETKVLTSDQDWIELDSKEKINDYYYFSTPDIKEKLKLSGFEDSNYQLAINFKTRKVFEKTGIKIDGTKYHSQYNLSGGQKLVAEETSSKEYTQKTVTVKNYGLTAYIELDWKYKKNEQITDVTDYEYQKSGETIWHSVTEYNEGESAARITESGTYIVRAAGDDSSKIENIQVTLVNPPILSDSWEPRDKNGSVVTEIYGGNWYDYTSSEKFAYAYGNGKTWVWIPRHAYKIESGKRKIEFLKEKSNTTTANKLLSSDYIIDSDFTNKTGLWVLASNVSSYLQY